MKFSKKLEQQQGIAIFRGQWVTYRALKNLIKDLARVENSVIVPEVFANQLWWFDSSQKASLGSISAERVSFIQIVEYEINKTSQYYASQRKRIADMIRLEGNFGLEHIMHDLDTISAELAIFGRYIWQAKQLLLKITKKHDKCTKFKVNTWFLVRLEKEEFWNPKLDELVIGLSETYSIARSLTEKPTEEVKRDFGNATEDFVRKNEKFFVKPEDVLLVKLIIIRYLPLDIVELNKFKSTSAKNALSGIQDNCVINSIYLDNDSKEMYHDRTGLRGTKGNIIRIRWYGSHANPATDCWVERKTRQVLTETEYYQIDEAVKERFRVNERNVRGYLTGEWKMDKKLQNMLNKKRINEKESKETLRKATAIQDEVTAKSLKGSLRTVVRRSAFQRGGDQNLRFSLDTNLHIINENVEMDKGKWSRNLNMPLRFDEVVTLPYAILEVKTQSDAPAWVDELRNSGYLIPAPNFSKFLYGTCKLWPDDIEFTPSWWNMLTELEKATPGTPALASIHEKISHFGHFATAKQPFATASHDILSDEIPLPASSSAKPNHKDMVEKVYGNADFLKRSMEMRVAKGTLKRDKSQNLVQTIRREKKKEKVPGVSQAGGPVPAKPLPAAPVSKKAADPVKQPEKPTELKQKQPAMPKEHVVELEELQVDGADKKAGGFKAFVFNSNKGNDKTPPKKQGNKKAQAAEQRAAKVYFANERTLLSWLNTATFLSLTGVTLLNTQTDVGRIAGVALTFVTIMFACYALYKYLKRLIGLRNRKDADVLDDKYGPIALITMFVATLVLVGIYFAINGN